MHLILFPAISNKRFSEAWRQFIEFGRNCYLHLPQGCIAKRFSCIFHDNCQSSTSFVVIIVWIEEGKIKFILFPSLHVCVYLFSILLNFHLQLPFTILKLLTIHPQRAYNLKSLGMKTRTMTTTTTFTNWIYTFLLRKVYFSENFHISFFLLLYRNELYIRSEVNFMEKC